MRLFSALWRKRTVPGHIYRGKNRLVERVTLADRIDLKNKFAIEEENMFYLRHAYLTPEQSSGHGIALRKQELRMQRLRVPNEFKEHVTLESRLGHIKYKEAWE